MHSQNRRILSTLLLGAFLVFTYVPKSMADATSRDQGFYDQTYEIGANRVSYRQGVNSSSWSGAFTYSLPITLPAGRGGFSPTLALNYSSQNRGLDNFFGYGWSMDFPSITRLNKTGVNQLYTDNYFSSSFDGELVATSGTGYAAKVENGSFYIYNYDGTYWTATDKSGTVYTFGPDSSTRQTDPSDSSHVYRWMLQEVRDTNDNFISYVYTEDGWQIYPSQISYTGSGTTEGPYTVDFTLESRGDVSQSYGSGFEVSTNNRVSTVNVSFEGSLIRQYQFSYTTPDNTPRSLLQSVTETDYNSSGSAVALEPTTFSYDTSTKGWTETSGYTIPVYFYMDGDNGDKGVDFGDINGDGFVDIINSMQDSGSAVQKVYLNAGNGSGWFEDTTYSVPVLFWQGSGTGMRNTRMADLNGDGFSDILYSALESGGVDTRKAYIFDTTSSTWVEDSSYSLPARFNDGATADQGIRLVDVNGDEYPDFVQSLYNGSSIKNLYLYDPEAGTWSSTSSPSIPVYFNSTSDEDEGVKLADVNGDGLVDLIQSRYDGASYHKVYLNRGDGTGWYEDSGYSIPIDFWASNDIMMDVADLLDVNSDGLPDIVYSADSSTENAVYINQGDGTGWAEDSAYTVPVSFAYAYRDPSGSQMFDVNGDGSPDLVQSLMHGSSTQKVYINNETPLLLTGVEQSKGASLTVSYAPSTEFDNPDLPFAIWLVSSVTTDDGLTLSSTVSYDYADGSYFYEDQFNRQFAGFGSVTKTENGRETVTYYEQDSLDKIGHPYQTDIYDNSGALFSRQIDTWSRSDLGYDNTFVYKSQSVAMTYDGGSTHRDTGVSYTYDSYGNVKTVVNYGEVNASTSGSFTDVSTVDEKTTTTYTYATDSSHLIRNKVSEVSLKNGSSTVLQKTRYFYDSTTSYGTVSVGNMQRQADWLDTSSIWYNSYYTYNAYGMVSTIKNPRGYTTSITYDSYYLYPAVTTNPKGYTVSTSYDYFSGQVSSQTNENGAVSSSTYDGLGRVLTVSVPDPVTGTLTQLSSTSYDDVSVPNSSTTTVTVDGVNSISVVYYDGLGRTVQTNTLAEGGVYNTVDVWYDDLGNVYEQSLPYETSSSAFGRDSSAYGTVSSFDPMNRPLTITTPTGSTNYDYLLWENTVTDPNGSEKVYNYGAAGQLLSTEEHNAGDTYTSSYTYDPLNELTQLTDAQGNVRSFDYDSLGRKISQTDLHNASETSYGSNTYTYDKNNNLSTVTNAAGQVITYAYDQLDRVSYEDWDTSTTARDFQYIYDAGTHGKMHLYRVNSNFADGATIYSTYDYLGNPTKETYYFKKPGLTTYYSYLFQTTYDLLNRPSKVVYPGSTLTVNYTYNEMGALEKVTRGTTTLTNVVSDFDYSPAGQVEYTAYGNGTATTNTYNPAESYRLTNKVTTGYYSTLLSGASLSNIQDLSYNYDSVGNITGITDASSTPTAKTLSYGYDDLYRLTSASSSGRSSGDFSQSYTYDSVGNLTYKSDVGTLTYSGTGSSGMNPQAVSSVNGTAYTYDSNGNVTSDGTHTYTWDRHNRLTDSGTETFSYDASGSRYKTVDSSSGSNVYAYYAGKYEELRNGSSTSAGTATYYIWAGGQRVASLSGTTYSYTLQDHLGGTALTTNASGYVTQIYDYYPYGSELENTTLSTTDAAHSFTDKELDDSLGIYYFEARWYDPDIGRFMSADPMDGVSYTYGANNPIIMIDPTGLYNVETGDLEEGDTKDDIVQQVNDAYGIETNWEDIATASYLDPEKSIEDLLASNDPNDHFLAVGTEHTKDITGILDGLNVGIAEAGLSIWQLLGYANNGGQGDLKSWGDASFGTGADAKYWSYIYHGQIVRQDAPGNIHLGYEAGAYGIPTWAISTFGDITNGQQPGSYNLSGSDNSYDSKMAQWGYDMATNPDTCY